MSQCLNDGILPVIEKLPEMAFLLKIWSTKMECLPQMVALNKMVGISGRIHWNAFRCGNLHYMRISKVGNISSGGKDIFVLLSGMALWGHLSWKMGQLERLFRKMLSVKSINQCLPSRRHVCLLAPIHGSVPLRRLINYKSNQIILNRNAHK